MRARRPRSRRGASSHPSCSARRHCPCRCGRAVPLRGPSCVFVDSSFFRLFQTSTAPAPDDGADHTRVKHPFVNKDEPRMNTNRHEDRWTCFAAMTSRDEGRERGRPARTTLAQPHPSLPPGSTGNGARALLGPGPCRSCRQGGRAPHHGETERPPNAEDAGETPALPEGRLLPSFLLREKALPPADAAVPSRFVVLRVSSSIPLFFVCSRRAPPPPCWADHPRVKQPIVNKGEPRMDTNSDGPAWLR